MTLKSFTLTLGVRFISFGWTDKLHNIFPSLYLNEYANICMTDICINKPKTEYLQICMPL